jgi:non-heme Fe2+,alpha-ketoglutarate-dependent halogenase
MPKALTPQQVEAYKRDGFLFPIRMMPEEDAIEMGARMMKAREDGLLRIKGGQTKMNVLLPWVYEFATSERLLDIVEDLLGPDLMIYHSTLWAKQPRAGEYVSWHQDNTYFGHDPCEVLSVWLALTPATVETGCMQYLPGTHRLGQLGLTTPDVSDGNLLASGQTVDYDVSGIEPVPVILRPGEIAIHHAFLIHNSFPNRSDRPRMGMTFIYHPPSLHQLGQVKTSAMLVRGEDRYGNFDHEIPPDPADEPATFARFEKARDLYRAKVRELGNSTITRFD